MANYIVRFVDAYNDGILPKPRYVGPFNNVGLAEDYVRQHMKFAQAGYEIAPLVEPPLEW